MAVKRVIKEVIVEGDYIVKDGEVFIKRTDILAILVKYVGALDRESLTPNEILTAETVITSLAEIIARVKP